MRKCPKYTPQLNWFSVSSESLTVGFGRGSSIPPPSFLLVSALQYSRPILQGSPRRHSTGSVSPLPDDLQLCADTEESGPPLPQGAQPCGLVNHSDSISYASDVLNSTKRHVRLVALPCVYVYLCVCVCDSMCLCVSVYICVCMSMFLFVYDARQFYVCMFGNIIFSSPYF